jgi:hypothetical protein
MADPWFLSKLAPDVLLAGTIMNTSVRGPEAVTAQVRAVVGHFSDYTPVYEFEHDGRRVTEYTAVVDERPISGTGIVHVNAEGVVDEIVINHRPLSAALTLSRLVAETLGEAREHDEFFHPEGQSYNDLVKYTETHPPEL